MCQNISQDSAKNYGEAARCYREAIVGFKTVAQSKNISPKVKEAILSKCALYEERLRKLDRYLLSKADLSKLFRECVQFHEKADSATADRSSSSLLLISYDSDEEDNTVTVLISKQFELLNCYQFSRSMIFYAPIYHSLYRGGCRLL